ncbi:MAG TPA: hypothetical protein VF376_03950 [Thermoanaerobaculia bacterium]
MSQETSAWGFLSGQGRSETVLPQVRRETNLRTEALLVLAVIVCSLLFYFPYRRDMTPLYAFWDGPSYMMIAHDFYEVRPGNPLAPDVTQPPFYASHLPGYPLLVRALSFVGYDHALLLATILSMCAATLLFYRLLRDVYRSEHAAYLALVFIFLPPRWVLYHSVGASEPLFLAAVFASLYLFERQRIGLACVAAAVASVTRFAGLLIIPAYACFLFRRKAPRWSWLWLAVIPIGPALYSWYFIRNYGSVFPAIDRNLLIISNPIPFWHLYRILHSFGSPNTSGELYILATVVYMIGLLRLWRFPVLFTYCLFQFAFVAITSYDNLRYYLAIMPFALIFAFEDVIGRPSFRWVFPFAAVGSLYWASLIITINLCKNYADVARFLGIH